MRPLKAASCFVAAALSTPARRPSRERGSDRRRYRRYLGGRRSGRILALRSAPPSFDDQEPEEPDEIFRARVLQSLIAQRLRFHEIDRFGFSELPVEEVERQYDAFLDRFGSADELTARLAQSHARIYELPISYHGRSYSEGKKINWKDGLAALWYILKSNLLAPKAKPWTPPAVPAWTARELPSKGDPGS